MNRWWMGFLLVLCFAGSAAGHAQVSVYGEFAASNLNDGPKGDYLTGATVGVIIDGPKVFHHVLVSADINGRFVGKDGERLDSASVGPRFTFGSVKKFSPFLDFSVGFGRYNDGSGLASTDNLFGGGGGLARRVSSRLDVVVDYKYEYFGVNFNTFNPQTYSGGLIYHFAKR